MGKLDWLNIQRCANERFNGCYLDDGNRYIGESNTCHLAYMMAYASEIRKLRSFYFRPSYC